MSAIGLAEVADRTCMEGSGWSVVVVSESQINAVTEELKEEFEFLVDDDDAGRVQVFSESQSGSALVASVARMGPDDVALLPLPVSTLASVAHSLDYRRGRLLERARGVIVTSAAGVQMLAAQAPNLWSWVSARIWNMDPTAGRLDVDSHAGRLDPEARLVSLREGTGFTDAEVLERAAAGTLASDPVFAEWLVLLGRGDLLGQ